MTGIDDGDEDAMLLGVLCAWMCGCVYWSIMRCAYGDIGKRDVCRCALLCLTCTWVWSICFLSFNSDLSSCPRFHACRASVYDLEGKDVAYLYTHRSSHCRHRFLDGVGEGFTSLFSRTEGEVECQPVFLYTQETCLYAYGRWYLDVHELRLSDDGVVRRRVSTGSRTNGYCPAGRKRFTLWGKIEQVSRWSSR